MYHLLSNSTINIHFMEQHRFSLIKKSTLLWLIIILSFSNGYAQPTENDRFDYSLSSPYHTVKTHLKYLQTESYHPNIAAKVFDPAYVRPEEAEKKAIQLKQVLDGEGIYINMDRLSRAVDYVDSLSNKKRYYLDEAFPELYLEKIGQRWYYSRSTVNQIPQWHQEVYPFGTDKLLNLFPKSGERKYFGLYTWQLIGILILVAISFIIYKLFTLLFEKIILNLLNRGKRRFVSKTIIPVAKPISFLLIFLLLSILVPVLQLPITMNKYLILSLRAIWPIFAIVFFYRLVDVVSIYFTRLAEKTESSLDDQLVPMVRKILKTFIIVIGILFILDNLNFDITGIIAGLSIGGLAFALAAQDTLKNFFGSIMIFVDKPFQVGDWITSGEVDGTVEEVGFRSTRVRTFRNSVTYIPNGVIADRMIDNHGLRVYRRFYTQLALTYDTPVELIEVFVQGLKEIVKAHPKTRKDYYEVHLNEMADFSLNIMFYIFFKVPSWSEELQSRHEILISIISLAKELGVNFAFPTQTLHMETFPEKVGNTPVYSNQEQWQQQLEEFLKKGRPDTSR